MPGLDRVASSIKLIMSANEDKFGDEELREFISRRRALVRCLKSTYDTHKEMPSSKSQTTLNFRKRN